MKMLIVLMSLTFASASCEVRVESTVSHRTQAQSERLSLAEAVKKYNAINRLGEAPWQNPEKGKFYTIECRLQQTVGQGADGTPQYLFIRCTGDVVIVETADPVDEIAQTTRVKILGQFVRQTEYANVLGSTTRAYLLKPAWLYPVKLSNVPKYPHIIDPKFAPVENPLQGFVPPRLLELPSQAELEKRIPKFDPMETPKEWQARMERENAARHRAWLARIREVGYDPAIHKHEY